MVGGRSGPLRYRAAFLPPAPALIPSLILQMKTAPPDTSTPLPALVAAFFGLACEPFSIAPDPRFLFMSEMHREALAHLLYGVSGGGGFVLLTGEIGAGKTTVCRCFLDQIPADCNTAYIVNPKLTVVELLRTVCDEFHIELPGRGGAPLTVKDCLDPLNRYVLDAHAAGRNNVLIIDEAQNLSAEVLEQLRLLTNLETAERKLLQIVLIGQPELRTLLARPELEQLAQRVIARYHLPALSEVGTRQYVLHRLSVAGLQGEPPFDDAALRRIHRLTGGVPRRINLLCGRALLGAYAHGRVRVGRRIVDQAAREVFEGPLPADVAARSRWAAGAAGLLAGAVLVGAGFVVREKDDDAKVAVAGGARSEAAAGVPAGALAPPSLAATSGAMTAAPMAVVAVAPAPATGASASLGLSNALPSGPAMAMADEAQAWRELAGLWGVTLGDGDPCQAAARQQLQCFRSVGGLALVRQLGRPGIVTLQDGNLRRGHALLVAVDADGVRLRTGAGAQTVTVSLAEMARLWRGDFATLWRAPPGYRDGASGAALVDWLAPRLPAAPTTAGSPSRTETVRAQVQAFQLAQGLEPDGLIGPLTLMQLNRAGAVDEPRLGP